MFGGPQIRKAVRLPKNLPQNPKAGNKQKEPRFVNPALFIS
jgi:hypothetical protein